MSLWEEKEVLKLRQAGGYGETGAESSGKRVDQKYKENLMEKD